MPGKDICKKGEKEMKNAIYLDSDFVREEQDSVNALLRHLQKSTQGLMNFRRRQMSK
jgi:hypothetical protein